VGAVGLNCPSLWTPKPSGRGAPCGEAALRAQPRRSSECSALLLRQDLQPSLTANSFRWSPVTPSDACGGLCPSHVFCAQMCRDSTRSFTPFAKPIASFLALCPGLPGPLARVLGGFALCWSNCTTSVWKKVSVWLPEGKSAQLLPKRAAPLPRHGAARRSGGHPGLWLALAQPRGRRNGRAGCGGGWQQRLVTGAEKEDTTLRTSCWHFLPRFLNVLGYFWRW